MAEAREATALLLSQQPDNLYARRAASWVYLDSIKKDSLCLEEALPYAEQLIALRLDASEHMLWEQLYWQLARLLFRLAEAPNTPGQERLYALWTACPSLPGKAFSVLLKALLKHASGWDNLPAWLDSWGWDNLQPEDYLADQQPNGKTYPALAERAYLAAAKAYLATPSEAPELTGFLNRLDSVSEAHPHMLYLLYYRVQLRLKTGQTEDALAIFLPFARQKQRDFWVWDLMAELHPDQTDLQLACLAKALQCKAKPEFLVKIRQKFAQLLISKGRWAEAKTEIETIINIRLTHEWRIPSEIMDWTQHPAYGKAPSTKNNAYLYTQLENNATQLLYDRNAAVLAVVTGVNPQKQTAQYIVSEKVTGGFRYDMAGCAPTPGDCLMLILEPGTAPDGSTFSKVVHAWPTAPVDTPLLKTVTAAFKPVGSAGFVGDVYLDASLATQLRAGTLYEVVAVKAFNSKRQSWGWKAVKVVT